jgi:DNA invertase Pin-like site-specific DNA recombinase
MDKRGYSLRIIRANEQADPSSIGVVLGRYCIKQEIPASDVADFFRVSRMTVYNWFSGSSTPQKRLHENIQQIIDKFSNA